MSFHRTQRSSLPHWIDQISPRRRCVRCILALLSVSCNVWVCDAQLLSAYEQAYGSWKIQLTRNIFGRRWYLEKMEESRGIRSSFDLGEKIRSTDLQLLFPVLSNERSGDSSLVYSAKSVRSVSCILNLEKNGKFAIYLDEEGLSSKAISHATSDNAEDKPQTQSRNELHSTADRSPATASPHRSALRGEWFLTPNPYCVTDRHYDTLTLISEPRIRRANFRQGVVTEMAKVELRCKLWGRYGVGAVRNKLGLAHGREMGRITHGTVMVVREYANENRSRLDDGNLSKESPRREIIATFTGHGMAARTDPDKERNNIQNELSDDDRNEDEMDLDELENEF
ncbi:hypothetical protein HJC23_006043 [Cyclotella cryptica]|uniref:Uncharacterized protein n=1 Tax=Cyclotella cryptica TaxID=29204 RepID=A0ABD3PUK9_9STRA|eukprot:CCRYP_011337-RA/>CCRYP_011337-RA protein AED:0.09 eAED:0.09 QI:0/-1/0/1/-1/1/1/0/339